MENWRSFIITFFDISTNFFFLNDEEEENYLMNESMNTYYDELFKESLESLEIDVSKTKPLNDNFECRICLDKIDANDDVYLLSCEHIFHIQCLDRAINQKHKHCPICRQEIKLRSFTANN